MQEIPSLSPLVSYELLPVWIALGVVMLIVTWYLFVFWLTRKRKPKVLAALPSKPPAPVDNSALKQNYLQKIEAIHNAYKAHELTARQVHQQLSITVRDFVTKIEHMPVLTMTLADLRKSRHHSVALLIESYYQPEFASIETGSVEVSLEAARKVVSEWS